VIPLDRALGLLLEGVEPLGAEPVALDAALGRTLAEDLVATHDQPVEARSAMDGIAVAVADPAPGDSFALVGDSPAGAPFAGALSGDQAVRIATGGVVPKGGLRVIPQELLEFSGGLARLTEECGSSRFIRPAGQDFAEGARLLAAGTRIGAGALGLIAAANVARVPLRRRPEIAILSSGDELTEPGARLAPGATIDSAGPMIAALGESWGARLRRLPRIGDDEAATIAALREAVAAHDVVVTIGGASVGRRDFLRGAARALGAELRFERIAVQPGKPCWHARFERGAMVLGLPGNPASAFVCAHLLLRPLVAALLGQAPGPGRLEARLDRKASAGSRTLFLRGVARARQGSLRVSIAEDQDSSLVGVLGASNCLVEIPSGTTLAAGALARLLLTGELDTTD